MYSIKTRVVGFFHCRVCLRKATCGYFKRHAFIFLTHNLISSHVVYMVHGTCLMSGPCTMYLRQVHTRAGRIWHVHDDKELQEMSVQLFLGICLSYSSHFVPFPLSLGEKKIKRTRVNPRSKPCTLACC